ncbi:MAG TPA: hypothetical protein VLC09_18210 [Polyangiaceae bacterium]|nr:hypothetical protein [Polyangiaceae bacterium]
MSVRRPVRWIATVALAASPLALLGCTTGAIAVNECREIEYLRCEASVACGLGDIENEDDVTACKSFYRDQCLHGIAGPKVPTAKDQKDCVATIQAAADCAKDDPEKLTTDCAGVDATTSLDAEGGRVVSVCDVVGRPWDLEICDYLLPKGEGGSSG